MRANDEEFLERAYRMAEEEFIESKGVVSWWYLSYADDDGFRGGLYIRAFGPGSAALRANIEGLSPGGEVRMVGPLPENYDKAPLPPTEARERLLTLEEMKQFAPMVRWDGETI